MVSAPSASLSGTLRELKEKGDKAYSGRDYATAAESYSEALETSRNAVILSNRSATYAQRRRFDKALADADLALQLEPRWAKLYHRRGHALFHLGRLEEARAAFQKGLELEPEDLSLLEARSKLEAYSEEGESFWPAGEYPGEKLPEQPPSPSSPSTPPEQPTSTQKASSASKRTTSGAAAPSAQASTPAASAEELRERGNALFREGKHSKAVRMYDQAIRADPSDARCWANRAAAQMGMLQEFGKGLSPEAMRTNPYFTNSLDDLSKALSIDSRYIKAWARKGQLHGMAAEAQQALNAFERGLAIDPNNAECLAGRRWWQSRR
eukprot:TRINITY_DN95723_c0_g1_i1.p1 TRINITY_DN95723_c0_g1~~TRINITY_DN95723_c0_g1_i1.p1  ORF type:complete len:348 (+),score=69.42 TRINITY_DN95723_c0_g1_i1:73-1044(+)